MNNKKAQVTLFIVIGVVLLLSTTIYLGVKGKLTFFDPDSVIAPDKVAVKNFVESCLRETVQDGIILVAFQGGYASIEEGSWKINKGGDYQEFLGSTGFKIPFWENKGRTFEPDQGKVERNLEIYIDNRIETCFDNLSTLREFYDISVAQPPKSTVVLGSGKVTVGLTYPIVIKTLKDSGSTTIDNFKADVNTNMLGALELAHLIKKDNDEHFRLNNLSIEMISGSELPFKGYEFDCRDKTWTMDELESDFNNLASANLRYLTFKNTYNEGIIGDYPYPKYYANKYFYDIGAEGKHKRFSVSVSSLKTTSFSVFPNKGGVVVKSIDLQLPVIGGLIDPCINLYNHFYSMDYSVKFTITDETGLKFNFILPVNMAYNKPKILPEQFDMYSVGSDDNLLYSMNYSMSVSDYCQDANNEFDVYVEDEITGDSILNASIFYDCVSFRCKVGTTDYVRDYYGIPISRASVVHGKFPDCTNGNLVVESNDYISNNVFITPSEVDEPMTITLKPIISVPVNLNLIRFTHDAPYEDEFDYSNYSVIIGVTNNDMDKYEFSIYINGVHNPDDFIIKIPINNSGNNNITFDVKTINLLTNMSIGGYYYNGVFDGRTLASANNIILPVLASELDPITNDEMLNLYKDIVMVKSLQFKPVIS